MYAFSFTYFLRYHALQNIGNSNNFLNEHEKLHDKIHEKMELFINYSKYIQ